LELSQLVMQVSHAALQALQPDKHVSIRVAPSTVRVTPDQAHYLALVINELVTNTAKHALQDRDQARVEIESWLEGGAVTVSFRDDGPGYPRGVLGLTEHHVGFDLIQSLVHDGLRGELTLYNAAGAVALARFPSQVVTNQVVQDTKA
jgi:two-component system, sensor histidine kinase PdtaS